MTAIISVITVIISFHAFYEYLTLRQVKKEKIKKEQYFQTHKKRMK